MSLTHSMAGKLVKARETAELLLHLGRLVQAEGYRGELSPAQWMALRFFARANSISRTPSAFAEFQATTRGTASQAIKALEAHGYLVRLRSGSDRRSFSLRLTKKADKALAHDPFEALISALATLDEKTHSTLHRALHQVLADVAATGQHRHFGICRNCAHCGADDCCRASDTTSYECLRFGIPIDAKEAELLCAHFLPRNASRGEPSHG